MPNYPSFWKWLRASVLTSPIVVIWVYVLFHVILKVPLRGLISPGLAVWGAWLPFGPLMFFARRYSAYHNDDKRIFVPVIASYTIALMLIGMHYIVKFKVLSSHDGYVVSVISTVFLLFSVGLAIAINKSLRGRST